MWHQVFLTLCGSLFIRDSSMFFFLSLGRSLEINVPESLSMFTSRLESVNERNLLKRQKPLFSLIVTGTEKSLAVTWISAVDSWSSLWQLSSYSWNSQQFGRKLLSFAASVLQAAGILEGDATKSVVLLATEMTCCCFTSACSPTHPSCAV